MILYNITISIDNEVHDEWMDWMKHSYITQLLNTGLFLEYKIFQLLNEEPNGGTTYAFQLFLANMKDYEKYLQEFDQLHQKQLNEKYKGRFGDFKTLLKLI